jgi:hypothetical protein
MDKLKAHLIEDWRKAYTFLSVQLAALLVLLEVAYAYTAEITSYLPEHTRGYVAGALIAARVWSQAKVKK